MSAKAHRRPRRLAAAPSPASSLSPSFAGEAGTAPRRTLAETAYDRVEALVVTLRLQPGSFVTEGELAARVGLGRTPVREALQRLGAQGLVTALPRRGIRVAPLHGAELLPIVDARRPLERLIAGRAARLASAAQRSELERLGCSILVAAADGDLDAYLGADHACDGLLEAAAQTPWATLALGPMRSHCRRFWFCYRHERDLEQFAALHAALMERVARGAAAQAERAADRLLDALEAFSRAALEAYSPVR